MAANLLAAESDQAPAGVFNIARGEATSLLNLLRLLQSSQGLSREPEFQAAREGDIVHSAADISRARSVLGFSPGVSLADGLKSTAEYFSKK